MPWGRLFVIFVVLWGPLAVALIVLWAAATTVFESLRRRHRRRAGPAWPDGTSIADEAHQWLDSQ